MDRPYLQYVMAHHGISRQDLIEAEDWSHTTYTRKVVSGDSDWTVGEIRVLLDRGVSHEEVRKIFFDRGVL